MAITDIPDPFPMPPNFAVPNVPPPPEKPTQAGIRGWLARRKWPEIEAGWRNEVAFTKLKYEFYNKRQRYLIFLENIARKIEDLDFRINNIGSNPDYRSPDENLALCEQVALSQFAAYQLKRDYFGDMDPEALRAEFREILRKEEDIGWLRKSKDPTIIALVGDGRGFPALPPPQRREDPRITASRWKDDLLELRHYQSELLQGRFFTIVKYRRLNHEWGTPFTPEFQDYCFEHEVEHSSPSTIRWWNKLDYTRYTRNPDQSAFQRETYDPKYVELYGLHLCKHRRVGG